MLLDLFDKAGNLFDLPGSMVRDALTLNNPLDQLLSPLSSDNRMDGRDVLEKWGMLGPNTEGLDVGDVAGTAAGIALDPLTWVSGAGVMKLLGRGSKSAKAGTGTKAAQALLDAPVQSRALVPYRSPSSPLQSVLQGPTSLMTPVDADPFAVMREAMGQPKPAALPAPAPVFYSRLRRAIEQLPDNPKGYKSQSVLNMLKKAPEGISMDEFNFSGLPEQLAHTPLVSKAMLQDVMDENLVNVRDIRLNKPEYKFTGPGYTRDQLQSALDSATGNGQTYTNPLHPERGQSLHFPLERSENVDLLTRIIAGLDRGRTVEDEVLSLGFVPDLLRGGAIENVSEGRPAKWWQHALPNSENYKETLLQETRNVVPFEQQMSEALGRAKQRLDSGEIQPHNFEGISDGWNRKKERIGYASPHWDDPDVTAHLRTTTRNMQDPATGVSSPTHFIDELQSDWHQAGRKYGYAPSAQTYSDLMTERNNLIDESVRREVNYLRKQLGIEGGITNKAGKELYDELNNLNASARHSGQRFEGMPDDFLSPQERARVHKLNDLTNAYEEADEAGVTIPPNSPFANNWQDVALKRALYDAAAQGSEGIGWSLGEDIQKIVGGAASGQDKFYNEEIGNRLRKLLASKGQKDAAVKLRGIPEVIGDGDTIDYTGLGHHIAIDPKTRARILAEGFPLLSLPFLAAFGLTGGEQRGVQ